MIIVLAIAVCAVFVKYLGLNIVMGVLTGLLAGMGLTKRYFVGGKALRWLFHIVFVSCVLAMIFLLSEYVSGEIISVVTLWVLATAVFSYRETRLTILSSSTAEKK